MPFYVYILQSEKDGTFYKGVTSNFKARLKTHNSGGNVSTKSRRPWKMIYLHAFDNQSEALKEERRLKRCNKNYLRWLCMQPSNILIPDFAVDILVHLGGKT